MSDLRTVLTPVQVSQLTSLAWRRSAMLNHHHVAVVLSCKTGRVLASATNEATACASVHAEVAALRQLHRRTRDGVLRRREFRHGVGVLSLRLNMTGQLRLAKPCSACFRALGASGVVRWVAWSDAEGGLVHDDHSDSLPCRPLCHPCS